MRNTVKDNTLYPVARIWHSMIVTSFLVTLTACGEVDKSDGNVVTSVNLPTDSVLTLYCPDAGIGAESCILDDPDNPYATTPISDDNKFFLQDAAPSAKARFYVWATAQAMSPRGENQYYVGLSLQQVFAESSSDLARKQALKAYRSVLDNYFYSVSFTAGGTPFSLRKTVGANMFFSPAPFLLFDQPVDALKLFGEWGYTYDIDGTFDITPNF